MGHKTILMVFAALAVAGCRNGDSEAGAEGGTDTDGADDGDGDSDGDGADDDGSDDGEPSECGGSVLGAPAPLRRLTHWEFDNTVDDLLGDDSRLGEGFPTESSEIGFDNQAAALSVGSLLAEQYMGAAETLAANAVADLDALLPCDPAGGEDACAEQWIESFGQRAFRRPLTTAQRDRLVSVYAAAKAEHGFDVAIELVLQTILQSPYFLYRVELGMPDPDDEGAVPLDDWEIATRLSYLLWGSMPDDELFAAADAGELQDPDAIAAQAERMLDDPRARRTVDSFHRQWLRLDDVDTMTKDPAVFANLDDATRASIKSTTLAFLEDVVFDGAGDLETILTADYGFVDDETADLYGVAPPGTSIPTRVDLPAGQRAGILTQPSLLAITSKADQTSPVQRGAFVQARLMCTTLPEPPPDVDTTPPEVDPDATTRERFEQHSSDPSCAGCHVLIDPVGFGLEHYDAMGRWRDTEAGMPVDASGTLLTLDGEVDFDGALELAGILAEQDQVRQCFVQQWFTFAHGRGPDDADECSLQTLDEMFVEADQDVRSLLVALTRTESFRYREGN